MTETDNAQIMQRRQSVLVDPVPSQVTGHCPQPTFASLYCHGKGVCRWRQILCMDVADLGFA
jgi:hypothetical protein